MEPSNIFRVSFAAAVPFRTNMLALVMPSANAPLSGENEAINGTVGPAGGAVVMLFVIVTLFDPLLKICSAPGGRILLVLLL